MQPLFIQHVSHTYTCAHVLYYTQGGSAEIELEQGDVIRLSTDEQFSKSGNKDMVYVDYENIVRLMAIGDTVYIDDGLISMRVIAKDDKCLITGE